ncbi:CDGSH iron-sulfur domain-containing protein [Gloeothece verrucosa]|uniref:Iron sulfur domain-containing, CDGSH-type n=1 Tax=Gloeothece verrucosa (strain PCC 7822) TaxID=497965 RepID=E0ULN4_GLOV7|nr:CDGSH iron-sulfur domain-containing protein [Gloeothece verrucosa]ADN17864.1 Iron sulfur domain-containing, CDGSH-type [Gloeothece verrucosa PCC 7822]
MNRPTITNQKPKIVELDSGVYFGCTCGQSDKFPFCDGTHKNTDFVPVKLTLSEKKKVAFCECKKSQNTPFCDGSHSQL